MLHDRQNRQRLSQHGSSRELARPRRDNHRRHPARARPALRGRPPHIRNDILRLILPVAQDPFKSRSPILSESEVLPARISAVNLHSLRNVADAQEVAQTSKSRPFRTVQCAQIFAREIEKIAEEYDLLRPFTDVLAAASLRNVPRDFQGPLAAMQAKTDRFSSARTRVIVPRKEDLYISRRPVRHERTLDGVGVVYQLGNAGIELINEVRGVIVQLGIRGRYVVGSVGGHGFRKAAWRTEVRRVIYLEVATVGADDENLLPRTPLPSFSLPKINK
ncbi:hypothetical protein K466DRAFT_582636 [Polyporus arcularius HHB13444]|uniref:Uncharacterized protein n=1 Tax=Polyporus arcularius HHB13444 TaxID=1314778 RepID=A0A5C3PZL4_9APHY|nr:hypothetical protein K466DRAFT_582636 [Polyporus arcularius HHB13444]